MIRVDHISLAVKNVYEAAARLREQTGLGFYDGGYTTTGIASRIFPLGETCYLQVEGIVDATALSKQMDGPLRLFHKQVSAGECFRGFALGVDTLEELEREARRLKLPVNSNPASGRILPNGDRVTASGVGSVADLWPRGLPNWNFFPDSAKHPSGQPVSWAPGLVKPLGIAEIELGGTEQTLTPWVGVPLAELKLRLDGNGPGIRAVSVRTEQGIVKISRPSVNDVPSTEASSKPMSS